jgi:hypothetical protein
VYPTAGTVRTSVVAGGRVTLQLDRERAELVSATANPGWTMRVWKSSEWIRVHFTRDGRASDVFCTWNDHPPIVETGEQ